MIAAKRAKVGRIVGYALFLLSVCLRIFVYKRPGTGIIVILFIIAIGIACIDITKDRDGG